jgi:hypothetical protein
VQVALHDGIGEDVNVAVLLVDSINAKNAVLDHFVELFQVEGNVLENQGHAFRADLGKASMDGVSSAAREAVKWPRRSSISSGWT